MGLMVQILNEDCCRSVWDDEGMLPKENNLVMDKRNSDTSLRKEEKLRKMAESED